MTRRRELSQAVFELFFHRFLFYYHNHIKAGADTNTFQIRNNKGLDESFYMEALKANNTDIIENAQVDRESWVDRYKRPVTRILARLSELRDYKKDAFNDLSNVRRRPLKKSFALLQGFGARPSSLNAMASHRRRHQVQLESQSEPSSLTCQGRKTT